MLLILKVLYNVRQAEIKKANASPEAISALKCNMLVALREWTGLKNMSRNLSSALFADITSWMKTEHFQECDASAIHLNYIRVSQSPSFVVS